jgi:hypothetical protein
MKLTALAVTLALILTAFLVPAPYVIFLVPITGLWFIYETRRPNPTKRTRP